MCFIKQQLSNNLEIHFKSLTECLEKSFIEVNVRLDYVKTN